MSLVIQKTVEIGQAITDPTYTNSAVTVQPITLRDYTHLVETD